MQLFFSVVFCVFSLGSFAAPDNPRVMPPAPLPKVDSAHKSPQQSAAPPSTVASSNDDSRSGISPKSQVGTGSPDKSSQQPATPPSATGKSSDGKPTPRADEESTLPDGGETPRADEESTLPDGGETPRADGESELSDAKGPQFSLLDELSDNVVYLDDMVIGRAIQENKPQAYEEAFRELIGLGIRLKGLVELETEEGRKFLELMILAKSKYFTKEMERILHLALVEGMFDIPLELQNYERVVEQKPFEISFDFATIKFSGNKLSNINFDTASPRIRIVRGALLEESYEDSPLGNVQITSLVETAFQAGNEEAVLTLKNFQKLVKKIQLEYIEAQQMALDILKRSRSSSSWMAGTARFAAGIAAMALGGFLVVEGMEIISDTSARETYQVFLESIINHLKEPEALIASGAGVAALGFIGSISGSRICSRAFRKNREISRQKQRLNQHTNRLRSR